MASVAVQVGKLGADLFIGTDLAEYIHGFWEGQFSYRKLRCVSEEIIN